LVAKLPEKEVEQAQIGKKKTVRKTNIKLAKISKNVTKNGQKNWWRNCQKF
jgi:hypothetical protein